MAGGAEVPYSVVTMLLINRLIARYWLL